MIPSANSAKANWPAIGRSASAACDEVSMSVMPLALSVAAVAKTIASEIERAERHADQRVGADALAARARRRCGVMQSGLA